MKRNKWQYTTISRTVQGFNWDEFKLAMLDFEEGEVLLRKKIEWDVEAMRGYVHGPIAEFVIAMFKQHTGMVFTLKQMHKWLRDEFLPGIPKYVAGHSVPNPVSSESLGFDGYHKWINDIDDFCQDAFKCGIPPAEKVE